MSAIKPPHCLLALPVLLALATAGCGTAGGSSSSGSGTSSTVTPGGPGTTTQTATAAHHAVALAALGQSAAPRTPLTIDAPAVARWNDLVAKGWPAVQTLLINPRLELELRKAIAGVGQGSITSIQNIRNLVIDTAAPPGLSGSGSGTALVVGVDAPRNGTWRIALEADVVAQVSINVLGVAIPITALVDVKVEIADLRISGAATIDARDPVRPMLTGSSGAPQVSLRLTLDSQSQWASQVLQPLSAILDPIIRLALAGGGIYVQQQAGSLISQALPAVSWGSPAAPRTLPPGTLPLAPLAESISDDINRIHMPFDTLLPAGFDQQGYGNGNLVRYYDHGDSADWTGHYLAAEAIRYELTGDPRALAAAERAARGLQGCLDVAGGDLLSRCVVPMSSPFIVDIQSKTDFFVGSVNGVPTGSTGDVSRDSYLGTTLGMSQAFMRVPSLRARATNILSRNMSYLMANDWNAYMVGRPELSRASPFSQTPGVILFVSKAANLVDRPRFGATHDENMQLASILWLNVWMSSREVHESYYKFQIAGDEIFGCASMETDPAAYRDYVKELVILEDAVGFHENAYTDTVFGAVIPAAATRKGPVVEDSLLRWSLRPRRAFPSDITGDPTIAKASYAPPSYNPTGLIVTGPPELFSLEPLPVERRVSGDFLWIKDPFELKSWDDPLKQYPGLDMVLPYWMARGYGLIR